MRVILSPAKKMREDTDYCPSPGVPEFLPETLVIFDWMKKKTKGELKELWGCSDSIAEQNFERLRHMRPDRGLTPAVLSYEGIAYQYMAPSVFEYDQFDYVEEHLRIISAFYGVLRPLDGVTPYRLEMKARAKIGGFRDLYDFWGSRIYESVRDETGVIINLASKEYSRCVEKYLTPDDRYISIRFGEMSGDRFVTKGTYAKMARGEMVRYMAENSVSEPEELFAFDRLGYEYREDMSSASEYVFERK